MKKLTHIIVSGIALIVFFSFSFNAILMNDFKSYQVSKDAVIDRTIDGTRQEFKNIIDLVPKRIGQNRLDEINAFNAMSSKINYIAESLDILSNEDCEEVGRLLGYYDDQIKIWQRASVERQLGDLPTDAELLSLKEDLMVIQEIFVFDGETVDLLDQVGMALEKRMVHLKCEVIIDRYLGQKGDRKSVV